MSQQFEQLKIQDEITQIRQIVGDEEFGNMLQQVDVDMQSIVGLPEEADLPM